MIGRIWHGWTTPADADAYGSLLQREIFVGIQNREIPGYRGIQLFRRDLDGEVDLSRSCGSTRSRPFAPSPARTVRWLFP
jgi:hypothetical protein